jgi:hypothetical protein
MIDVRVKAVGVSLLAGVLLLGVAVAAASSSRRHITTLQWGCSAADNSPPCHFRRGTYRLGSGTVLRGLQLTLPRGWSSTENDQGELNLIPRGHPGDTLFVWIDMAAVKSTGPGHGTTILSNVGRTPSALVSWLTTNPDFQVVSPPEATKIARRIPATTLTMGVSSSANYGDPGCPSNPRCADFFTRPVLWGSGFYGIGYPGEVQLSLASIKRGTHKHTLIVALDAMSASDLITLREAVRPVVSSFRLPKTVTAG